MNKKKIQAIVDLLFSAEKSIKNAKKILQEVLKEENISLWEWPVYDTSWLNSYEINNVKVIEGVFTGEDMLGVDKRKYPVPANYASKSKLVQWDRLKLTIDANGKMVYKQIQTIERETKKWILIKEKDKYGVIVEGKTYHVLWASVSYFKAEVGDIVSVLLPKWKEATFAAIEMVLPKE